VSGFTSENRVYPDERAAIVVLVNEDTGNTPEALAGKISEILFTTSSPADAEKLTQARKMFADLQKGTIDRSLLTANASEYFNATALADFKKGLAPLGAPVEFTLKHQSLRGGMSTRVYLAKFAKAALDVVTRAMPDGKFEQYQVAVE
jgi:hypothetical protein